MRILYISYFYPPLGGPAVLRNVKTVRYLAQHGIACDVISVREPVYIYRDESLLAQCSEEQIWRTNSLDPMLMLKKSGIGNRVNSSTPSVYTKTPEKIKLWIRRMFPLDDKVGWIPFVVQAGKKAISAQNYDLIYVSLGPFSSGVAAYLLSRRSGIPLVVDLRDYWGLLTDYELQGSALHRKFALHWEKKIYDQASLLVTATQGIGSDVAGYFGKQIEDKLLTVYNGWDEQDWTDLPAATHSGGFVMSYFGTIYARRSLKAFYAAVKRLRDESLLPSDTRIKLFGKFFREPLEEIEQSGIKDLIEIVPQLEHKQALSQMLASDVLLLVINSSSPKGTLTSKVFEYLRAQKPILAMVPEHKEASLLLQPCGQDHICAMESSDSIYHCLKRLIQEGKRDYQIPWELERGSQIDKLASELKKRFGG